MNIRELHRWLEREIDDGNGDIEIAVAIQPSWPLALNVSGMLIERTWSEEQYPCTDEDQNGTCIDRGFIDHMCPNCRFLMENAIDDDVKDVCWIVVSDSHAEWTGSVYARKSYWNDCERL